MLQMDPRQTSSGWTINSLISGIPFCVGSSTGFHRENVRNYTVPTGSRMVKTRAKSLKGIVWVGVAMFLFGLASLFYPPLKAIIGSVTTSLAICAGGLALMILPTLIVGNELLILAGVAAAVGLWFLAHRHGQLSGIIRQMTNDE
jgi:hypothetical protein